MVTGGSGADLRDGDPLRGPRRVMNLELHGFHVVPDRPPHAAAAPWEMGP